MGKKIVVILLMLMLNISVLSSMILAQPDNQEEITPSISPIRSIFQQFFKKSQDNPLSSFFTSSIQTTCGQVEKTSTINFGLYNEIDVDENPQTGINGNDISIQYFLLPWITFDPEFSLGAIVTIRVERIGSEIKNQPFTLSSSISDGILELGYQTPQGNDYEIPKAMQLSAYVFYKPENQTKGITFNMNPQYEDPTDDHHLALFSTYTEEDVISSYEFELQPASEKQITIESTREQNALQFSFQKDVGPPTIAIAHINRDIDGELIQTNFTIDPLPSDVTFSLAMTPFSQGGGMIEYFADNPYDTNIILESNNIGVCKYVRVKKVPKQFFVEWDPAKEQGYYYLDIEAQGTDISLLDDLESPHINLSIKGIENVSFTALWNFSNPGDFTVLKDTSFHIDLDFTIDVWQAQIDAQPTAENIEVTWLTDITGYLTYDTNWQPLQEIDLLIKGSDLGIRTQGEFVKASDWMIEWTIWPPVEWNLDTSGEIEFSSIIIDVFIEGTWLRLWPW